MKDEAAPRVSFGLLAVLVIGLVGLLTLLVQNRQLQERLSRVEGASGLAPAGPAGNVPTVDSNDLPPPETGVEDVPEVPAEIWRLEAEEARALLRAEMEKNEKLRKEMLDLRRQVAVLSASLSDSPEERGERPVSEPDSTPNISPMRLAGPTGPGLTQATILDVNPSLGMAAVNVGSGSGVREGMRFAVVRDDLVIGRVRVTDVRSGVSGVEIEDANEPGLQKGDRVVPWKESNGS